MEPKLLLTVPEQQILLKLAQETLNRLFDEDPEKVLSEFEKFSLPKFPNLKEKLPCFVTLLVKRTNALRGCIGNTKTEAPIYENVFLYTRFAAQDDPRFPPVEKHEIEHLRIEISVLGPLHPIQSSAIDSIEIGKHGLVVRSGSRSGLLLAKVASEHHWTPQQFLNHTCEKAGLHPGLVNQYQLSYFEELSF